MRVIVCDGVSLARRLRGEHALHQRAQERRGRSLAGDVAEREAERRRPADRRSRRSRRRSIGTASTPPRRVKKAPTAAGLRQQRLLDLRRDPHLLLHPRLLERLAIEPGVLDRDRRLGGQRLERRARRARRAACPSRGCRDTARRCAAPRRRPRPRRRSARGAAARTARCGCRARPCPCARRRARRRAGRRRCAARRCGTLLRESCGWSRRCCRSASSAPAPRASLNSSSPSALASMMKPRSAPVTSIAESSTSASTSSSTRPEPSARSPSSSAGNLAQVADGGRRRPRSTGGGAVGQEEDHLGAAAAAEPDAVAVRERALGDRLAVDERAVARAAVAQHEAGCPAARSRRGRATPRCRPAAGRWSRGGRSRTGPLAIGTMRRPSASVTSRRASGMAEV